MIKDLLGDKYWTNPLYVDDWTATFAMRTMAAPERMDELSLRMIPTLLEVEYFSLVASYRGGSNPPKLPMGFGSPSPKLRIYIRLAAQLRL